MDILSRNKSEKREKTSLCTNKKFKKKKKKKIP